VLRQSRKRWVTLTDPLASNPQNRCKQSALELQYTTFALDMALSAVVYSV